MIFGLEYLDIMTVAFFIISTYVLIINLYTISKLRDEKKEIGENQKLLTTLLGQMQGYFSRIDRGIDRISTEEERLSDVFELHQREENKILDAIEANQELFLNRMERIVDIQQNLLERIKEIPTQAIIQTKILPNISKLSQMQNQESSSMIENALHDLQEHVISMESKLESGLSSAVNELNTNIQQTIVNINEASQKLTHILKEKDAILQEGNESIVHSTQSLHTLNAYIDLAQSNIKKVIDQSIDLSPIYKSVHHLIEQLETVQSEYAISKEDIRSLLHKLQAHEQQDLNALRNDVEGFLVDLKIEINDSVEILKKEFHLGQRQVSETVKTLSERSNIKKAYGIDE